MTDWAKIKCIKGSAKSVPALVKRLTGDNSEKVNDAFERLHEALVGDEKWCPASVPALELIFALLPKVKTEMGVVLLLVADIVGASHWTALNRAGKRPPKKIIKVVEAHLPALEALLASKDSNARAGFAQVAAVVPDLAGKTRAGLLQLVADREPTVRMSACLALGAVGGRGDLPAVRKLTKDKDAGVRGAATLAELALDDRVRVGDRQPGLQAWLSFKRPKWSESGPQFLWFAVHGGTELLQPLLDIAEPRGQGNDVLAALVAEPGDAKKAACELLLTKGGFAEAFNPHDYEGYVALPEELDDAQRAIAERLADSDLLPVGAYGLPASGAPRRRWLGLDPPGPSDVLVDVTVKKKRFRGPFWRVYQDLIHADLTPWGTYPEALAHVHQGLDRWEVMVDKSARSYGGQHMDFDAAATEYALVQNEPGLIARAKPIAADLARRFRAAQGYEWLAPKGGGRNRRFVYPRLDAQCAALLLLPFVHKKKVWPTEWDVMLPKSKNDLAKKIFAGLPAARRKAHARSIGDDED